MNEIAMNPPERVVLFNYDIETLALTWHDTIRRNRLHYLDADASNEIADTGGKKASGTPGRSEHWRGAVAT